MFHIQKLFVTLVVLNIFHGAQSAPKIGIVGSGIGGTSVAYFLQELFGQNIDEIDIFENRKIGGRIALETLGGCEYEAGGTIIHPRNKYMTDFLKLLNLKKRQGKPSAFGLYNGDGFAFVEDSDWNIWNTVRLIWRYGLDTMRLKQFIDTILEYFSRIYVSQDDQQSYDTVEDLLNSMNADFVDYLYVTSKRGFKKIGFSDKIIDELILATLLVNYGQTTSVHKFVGAVSVAGAMPGLWGVKGGNVQIPLKLLKMTNATLIKGKVNKVTFLPDSGRYKLSWIPKSGEKKENIYDIVIVATPLATNSKQNIEFLNFPSIGIFREELHQTVATFLIGNLNTSYFGLRTSKVNEIFSINSELFFNSVGEIQPVNGSKPSCSNRSAWKIFSRDPLTREQLEKLFLNIQEVKSVSWLAYPKYDTVPHKRKFVLNKNLYYINAIEWAASAMEMSVIGAKNVALLAFKTWTGQSSRDSIESNIKNEL